MIEIYYWCCRYKRVCTQWIFPTSSKTTMQSRQVNSGVFHLCTRGQLTSVHLTRQHSTVNKIGSYKNRERTRDSTHDAITWAVHSERFGAVPVCQLLLALRRGAGGSAWCRRRRHGAGGGGTVGGGDKIKVAAAERCSAAAVRWFIVSCAHHTSCIVVWFPFQFIL